jgi:hypothetical protein
LRQVQILGNLADGAECVGALVHHSHAPGTESRFISAV